MNENIEQAHRRRHDKRSARALLHAQRLRQRRARSRWRKAGIAAGIAVLLGLGLAVAASTAGGRSVRGPVPAHASGAGGTVIVYGDPNARDTLEVWEDFRCPFCGAVERTDGAAIQRLADGGVYKIQYHMGTFLDENLGGDGSKEALGAAGAALNEGAAMFKAFHDVLFADQPDERTDGFGDRSRLLALAAKVPALTTPAFVAAVKNGAYVAWARSVTDAFARSGVTSTPTFRLNGRPLDVLDGSGNPITPEAYTALVRQIIGER